MSVKGTLDAPAFQINLYLQAGALFLKKAAPRRFGRVRVLSSIRD